MVVLVLLSIALAGRTWLHEHPEHDPWAPLDLRDPPGWATAGKIAALRSDPALCVEVLERSAIAFTTLEPAGDGACRREDRTVLREYPLSPARPPTTCAVSVALTLWKPDIDAAAREHLGAPLARIEHLGSYSCRRKYGRETGGWSEHATGNAIDVAGFVLADSKRVSVLRDWEGDGAAAEFLRAARTAACRHFGITLSPDYNTAHADHFHLDMGARPGGVCR